MQLGKQLLREVGLKEIHQYSNFYIGDVKSKNEKTERKN